MDIRSKVEQRRAEREAQSRTVQAEAREATQREQVAFAEARLEERRRREDALDHIASDLSSDAATVIRENDKLKMAHRLLYSQIKARSHALHREQERLHAVQEYARQLSRPELEKLFRHEARQCWTPGDNWLVIVCISFGFGLLALPMASIPLLIIGFWRRSVLNKKYKEELKSRYPAIFGQLTV